VARLHTKFHENLPVGLKVIGGGVHTHRQTGDLINLLTFLKENTQFMLRVSSSCIRLCIIISLSN
jgi:hypothetical protein